MKRLMERISVDPHVCHGQPCIKGTRVMVYLVLELLEAGLAPEKIIEEYYPHIDRQDVEACLHYAAGLIRDSEYVPFSKDQSDDKVPQGCMDLISKVRVTTSL